MPAAMYWFGGLALAHGSHAITVPTLVAFTTLQTRLFFPVGSLLGVGLDVQTSLALFDRIFEYLDQPIDIVERARRAIGWTSRRRSVRRRVVPLRRRRLDARGRLVHGPAGNEDGARRRDRRRQDDARATSRRGCTTSSDGSVRDRRRRRARPLVRDAGATWSASSRRRRISSTRRCARTCASRSPTRPTRRSRRPRSGADPRPDRVAARGLRHDRRRARLPLLGRREAADRDRTDDPAQPADPGARRGDELARHGDRAPGAGGARPPGRRTHDDRDRPPALDRRRTPTRSSCSTAARIVERGTHDELLALGGRYAELVGRAPAAASSKPLDSHDGDVTSRRRPAAPPRVDEGPRAVRERQLLRREEADPRRRG